MECEMDAGEREPRPRAVFFGTPEIAVPALRALTRVADVVGVVCQPDRTSGRGMQMHAPAVKAAALELGLEVVQPLKVRTGELAAWMRSRRPDVALVLAYGRILPVDVLTCPRRGCVNLHASLLPRYRGAAPIQWAVVRGETETGVSLMQMDAGLDTGPVYSVRRVPIGRDETAGELASRLGGVAAEMVDTDLPSVVRGEIDAVPQLEDLATLAPVLKKEDGRIDWNRSPREIHDLVRGMQPWPGAYTQAGPKLFKVLATRPSGYRCDAQPGTVVAADASGVLVACAGAAIEIVRGQIEGKKAITGRELAMGRALGAGQRLG
jgi:methionyl-tRNA formyltransferase